MKTYGGVEPLLHAFITTAVAEVSSYLHDPEASALWIGGCVGPTAGRDILVGICRPALRASPAF
jgi:hypothetical protein